MELVADPAAVPSARLWLRDNLLEWGLEVPVDEAELVITEIVANAVNATRAVTWPASRPPVRLWVRGALDVLAVLVWDACATAPIPGNPCADDESGRGLMLVAAFACWGCYFPPSDGAGKVVWVRMPKSVGRESADSA